MKTTLVGFVLLTLGLASGPLAITAQSPEVKIDTNRKWEYRVLTKEQVLDLGKKDLATGLNQLGEDGWELAAVDGAYIFKRPKDLNRRSLEDVKSLVALIESDVEVLKERVAWAERMAKKAYLSTSQVEAERVRLKRAELALERARKELKSFPPEAKDAAGKERKPEK
jgi:hypothetical protein